MTSKIVACLRQNLLDILTIVSVLAAIAIGFIVRNSPNREWTPREIMYLEYPGDLYLRMLKCLVIPLLVTSIISAISSLDLKIFVKISRRCMLYNTCTMFSSVVLGIILALSIQPGRNVCDETCVLAPMPKKIVLTVDTLMDLVRNLFPPNIVEATIYQRRTVLTIPANETNDIITSYPFSEVPTQAPNMLGIIVFSVCLGMAIVKLKASGELLNRFCLTLCDVMMIITRYVMWLSPVGVFFLVLAKVISSKPFAKMLLMYCTVVLSGIFIQGLIVLPLVFYFATRRMPFPYMVKMGSVLATAFGTASSSATMPLMIQCMDELGLDKRIVRFFIPVGTMVNMVGTGLYEVVAALFIAQLRQKNVSFEKIVGVSITATAASVAATGVPQSGLLTMVIVLNTLGLPSEDLGLILSVDWLIDRFRTVLNVLCICLGAIIIDILSTDDLNVSVPEKRIDVEQPKHSVSFKGT